MWKYKGLFWPAIIGIKHMPKIKNSDYYNASGEYRKTTIDDKIAFFLQHPIWEGRPELFMKNGSPKEMYAQSGMSLYGVFNLFGQPRQAQNAADGFNYLVQQKNKGNVHFISGIYPQEEVMRDPDKGKVQGVLYQGEAGKPLAIVIPGGGFHGVGSYSEGVTTAMELHKRGYSAFILIYRVNVELHQTEPRAKGEEAARDVPPTIRYLLEHQKKYGYTMDGFSMFGFSAGGLMVTAYAFADYNDCCHKYHLPRPTAVFPIYGLHWDLKLLDEDKGLAVFTRVGRDDSTGFAAGEKIFPSIVQTLGKENVDIKAYDHLGHGFGLGTGTPVEGWMQEAIEFWEKHYAKTI